MASGDKGMKDIALRKAEDKSGEKETAEEHSNR